MLAMCNDCINLFEYAFMFQIIILFISAEFRTQLFDKEYHLKIQYV